MVDYVELDVDLANLEDLFKQAQKKKKGGKKPKKAKVKETIRWVPDTHIGVGGVVYTCSSCEEKTTFVTSYLVGGITKKGLKYVPVTAGNQSEFDRLREEGAPFNRLFSHNEGLCSNCCSAIKEEV